MESKAGFFFVAHLNYFQEWEFHHLPVVLSKNVDIQIPFPPIFTQLLYN